MDFSSSTDVPAPRKIFSFHSPLWIPLVAIIAGYTIAEAFPPANLLPTWCYGMLALGLAWKNGLPLSWQAAFGVVFLLALGSYQARTLSAHPDWQELPPREAVLDIKITRLFHNRDPNTISGIGKITTNRGLFQELQHHKIGFYLERNGTPHNLLLPGAILRAEGVLTYLQAVPSPSGFQKYLFRQGVRHSFNRGKIEILRTPPPEIQSWRHRIYRSWEQVLLANSVNLQATGIHTSMMLGNRTHMNRETEDNFKRTGTIHFFAISGLHVAVIASVLHGIARLIRLPAPFRILFTLVCIHTYVFIVGSPPSAVRAAIMVTVFYAAYSLRRQPSPIAQWVLSAVLVLLVEPRQLWQIGFQLSYTVVAAILMVALPAAHWFSTFFNQPGWRLARDTSPLRRWLLGRLFALFNLAMVSTCAAFFSAPWTILYFQLFSAGGLFINLFLAPIVALAVISGSISLIAYMLNLGFFLPLVQPAAWILVDGISRLLAVVLEWEYVYQSRTWSQPWIAPLAIASALGLAVGFGIYRNQRGRPPGAESLLPTLLIIVFMIIATVET